MGKLDDIGIDWVCDQITEGRMLSHIAKEASVSIATLSEWLSRAERSVRAREARKAAAATYAEMAEDGIAAAEDGFALAKAKEMAHHLRWKASKMNPSSYGDKVTQEITGAEGGPLQVQVTYVNPKKVEE